MSIWEPTPNVQLLSVSEMLADNKMLRVVACSSWLSSLTTSTLSACFIANLILCVLVKHVSGVTELLVFH